MLFRKFAVDFAEKYRTEPIQLDERAILLLENYRWPGNIRELKNVAEQLSVLAEKRLITAEDLIDLIPNISERNLPMIPEASESKFQEREILYKLLFEMKHDLTELKSFLFELIRNNNLNVSDTQSLRALQAPSSSSSYQVSDPVSASDLYSQMEEEKTAASSHRKELSYDKPIILDRNDQQYEETEVVEENLSLEENEKALIKKALKKHNDKRKEAAQDLGISERTLYRKIKQYAL